MRAGSTLQFRNVVGLHANGVVILRVSNGGVCKGDVALHVESGHSRSLLATCSVPPTGNWQSYRDISCKHNVTFLESAAQQKLVLTFGGECDGVEFAHLDHIAFTRLGLEASVVV